VTSEGQDAVITVSNAGTGFIRDKLIQVFEHFARDNAECNFGGVGIGLAICRAVIEAHGGQIAAINPETDGACVRFTLPLGEPLMIEPELGELA
jgi:two-component system sensor histidine kinase KdpD